MNADCDSNGNLRVVGRTFDSPPKLKFYFGFERSGTLENANVFLTLYYGLAATDHLGVVFIFIVRTIYNATGNFFIECLLLKETGSGAVYEVNMEEFQTSTAYKL